MVQRRARAIRANLERLGKDKAALSKSSKDCLAKSHQLSKKCQAAAVHDCEVFVNGLLSRISLGKGLNATTEGNAAKQVNGDSPDGDVNEAKGVSERVTDMRARYLSYLTRFQENRAPHGSSAEL